MPESATILPMWLVLPMAATTMLVVAGHLIALREASGIPESRRRIRSASGILIMFALPLIAYAFGIATPADPRTFLLVWLAVSGLLGIILVLAVIDMLNTMRLHRAERRRVRRELASARATLQALLLAHQAGPRSDPLPFGRDGPDEQPPPT